VDRFGDDVPSVILLFLLRRRLLGRDRIAIINPVVADHDACLEGLPAPTVPSGTSMATGTCRVFPIDGVADTLYLAFA
jgi:hypothetical protein